MNLNHGNVVIIFMKYVTSVVPTNFLTENFHLKQNGVTYTKSLKVLELVVNDLEKTFSESI